jgi:5,10-methenyltetrahydrofolate synthetase
LIPKTKLRARWKALRQSLPETRRETAAENLFSYIRKNLELNHILSFVSFGSEISTHLINEWLIQSYSLLLPRVEGLELGIYRISDPASDLLLSPRGILEPNPDRCEKIDLQTIRTVLTPGLAFDENFHRLGYGQGHYDRLLKQINGRFIGLAFSEQKTESLSTDPWDIPLHDVLYF